MSLQWKSNCMPIFVAFLCLICSIVGVKIFPEDSELVIGKRDLLTLNCSGDGPVQWASYPGMGERKLSNKKLENGINFSKLTIISTQYSDTGYYTCQSENNASDVAQIYVYCFDDNNVIVSNTSIVNATMYDRATIPCRPTSPNITMVLTKMEMGLMEEPIEKYDPKIGFVISTYPIINSMYFTCIALKYKSSRRITVKVHPPLNDSSEPYIEVTDFKFRYPILEKENAMMNCSVITSSNLGIKSIEWHFPKHVKEKISLENSSVIQHKNFNTFFQILNVYNLAENDQGNYTCTVTDDNSNVKHYTHSLHVIRTDLIFLNVTIPQETRELAVQAGGGDKSVAQFIATAKCFPKCQFTWYNQRNHKIGNTNSIFTNSKYSKYQISEDGDEIKLKIIYIKLEDFGTYQIEINNSFNRRIENFSLIVEAKPEINLKIYRIKLFKLNTTVHHECNATGYPVPQIAWSAKNCNNYPTYEDEIFKPIPASMYETTTTGTYEVMSKFNFTPNQSMIIQCVANNSLGNSNESSTFLLTDYYESGSGVLMIKNYSEPISVGDYVNITCVASKYYFKNFSWTYVKNYTRTSQMDAINPSEEIYIENSASNFSYITTLLIPNIQKNHSGRYSCGIEQIDSIRRKYNFTELTVHEVIRPSIVHSNMNNEDRQVTPGKTVTIIIQVDGYPSPSMLWYKDEKPLLFNGRINSTNIDRIENLIIANVSRVDEGVYKFIASNKAGNISDSFKLSIKGAIEDGNLNYILWISIFLLCFLVGVVFWYIRKLNKDKKKLKKMLREFGLEQCKDSAVFNLDPDLDIEEQTLLIPYNKKYEFPKEKLQFGKTLGSGAFGIVKKAEALGIIEKDVKTTVAVKVAKRHQDFLFVKALASELKIMIYLGQHLNVVNLLGACTKDLIKGELAVIVEYCRYGNIHDFLLKRRTNFVNQITKNDEIDFTITSKNSTEEISQYESTVTPSRSYNQEEETPIGADGYLINNDTICKSAGTTFQDESIFNDETTIGSDGYLIKNELYEPEWRSNYLADVEDFTTTSTIKTIDLICWSYQVARGMEYLASRKVLHGDLAARNILLTEDNIVKICDFGLAKSMYQDDEYQSSKTMFPVRWMALESIRDRVFSTQSDVWSFGITMWEFFSLSVLPYPGMEHLTKLYEKLESGYRLEKPAFATNKIYNIMRSCWEYHSKSRPSFTQLREQLGCLLEDSIRSQYIDLDEINKNDTNEMKNAEVYMKMLSLPVYCNVKAEPANHYVNIPLKPNSNPGYVEMKNVSQVNIVNNQGYI